MVAQISNATKQLDSMFANVVNQTIEAERQFRLVKLQSQRDALDVKNAVYTDLQNYLQNLQTKTKALISSDSSYAFGVTQKATVSNTPDGLSVLSATTDEDAVPASYEISIQTLAKNHSVNSERQVSSSDALGLTGAFTLNDVEFSVEAGDSLYAIAGKINEASYADDKSVTASVIDNRLVLTADTSGADYDMTMSGDPLVALGLLDTEGAFVNELAPATDAVFTVNGLTVTRSSNSSLDDVIQGVTLNLAADGEGSSATLTVETDVANVKNSINAMLSKYNELVGYIQKKTETVKVDDSTYQRGSLADDYTVRNLVGEMAGTLINSISGNDSFSSLFELGIEVGDNMQLSIGDSSKLEAALENHREDALAFLDTKMDALDDVLDRYIGSESVVSYSLESLDIQKESLETSITTEEERISRKESLLIEQYMQLQAQMDALLNTQQIMGVFNGYTSTGSYS